MRGLRSIARGGMSAEVNTRPKRVSEEWVVPPGLESFFPLSPALKRWAKLGRPPGLGFTDRNQGYSAARYETPAIQHLITQRVREDSVACPCLCSRRPAGCALLLSFSGPSRRWREFRRPPSLIPRLGRTAMRPLGRQNTKLLVPT